MTENVAKLKNLGMSGRNQSYMATKPLQCTGYLIYHFI